MSDQVTECEARYAALVEQRQSGALSQADFDAARRGCLVSFEGRYWMPGAPNGRWYTSDGGAWTEADRPAPPGSGTVPQVDAPSEPPSLPESGRLLGHSGAICGVAMAPDGRTLASVDVDGALRLWDTSTGAERLVIRGHITQTSMSMPVACVAFSLGGHHIITGGADRVVRIWDTSTGAEIRRLIGHSSGVLSAQFLPDGAYAVSSGHDDTVRVWEIAANREVLRIAGQQGETRIAIAPSGRLVAVANSYRTDALPPFAVYELPTGRLLTRLGEARSLASEALFAPDGRSLLCAGARLDAWSIETGQHALTYPDLRSVSAVAFFADSRHIVAASDGSATGAQSHCMGVFEAASGRCVFRLSGENSTVNCLAVSRDGAFIVAGTSDGALVVWSSPATLRPS